MIAGPYAQSLGPATVIVDILKKYKKVRIDFLAQVAGRPREDVEKYVAYLVDDGVLSRAGDEVWLTRKSD